MKLSLSGIKKVLYEIFAEPNGTLSWGRVAASVCLLAGIVWVSKVVIQTHTIPALDGITAFVLAPYATNKAVTAVQAFSQNPVNPTPPSVPPAPPQ